MNRMHRNLLLALRYMTLAVVCVLVAQAPLGAEDPRPVVNVSGEGVVTVPLKFARITLGVSARAKTAARAQADTAGRAEALVRMLKAEQVEGLQTVRIALVPIIEDKKTGREIEYLSTNTLSFRVELERAGELLDKAIQAGANTIDSVGLVPDDQALADARKRALAAAALDAREKARIVLGALGLREKQIVQIDVDVHFSPPIPLQQFRNEIREARTPVVGGESDVRVTVRMAVSY
jgi:hypothetical protein